MRATWVRFLVQEDPLEKGVGTHSSILAWRIPWTGQTIAWPATVLGVAKSRHDWSNLAQSTKVWTHYSQYQRVCYKKRVWHRRYGFNSWVGKIPLRRKWQPTPVFLPEESHGQRSLADDGPQGWLELGKTEWLCIHTCRSNQREKFFKGLLYS